MTFAGRTWRSISGIFRCALASGRSFDKDFRCRGTGRSREQSGGRADLYSRVHIAALGRCRAFCKIFRVSHGASRISGADTIHGEQSGFLTYIGSFHTVRLFKLSDRKIFVNAAHDRSPQFFVIRVVKIAGRERIVVVIAAPDRTRIIRAVCGKPDITVVRSRTGLAGNRHLAEADIGGCSAGFYNIHHRLCQQESGAVL